MLEEELIDIVVATLIDNLSQKLARRLGEVTIELRHIHVIDEEHHLLTSLWLQHILSERI